MNEKRYDELKLAERGALVSITAYVLISLIKLSVGYLAESDALRADGLNNVTDIIASVAVFVGLRLARKPADSDHRYGHWKAESMASMITSFIMLFVGGQILFSTAETLIEGNSSSPDLSAAIVGVFSAGVMTAVYLFNKRLAGQSRSAALMAAAKDNRSDAWTSIGTAVAVFAASFNLGWLDSLAAFVVGALIVKTGIDIFKESAFSLSDGFDEGCLDDYAKAISEIPEVLEIRSMKGRNYGANIFLDIVVGMDAQMSVADSHAVTEIIEALLETQFQVFDIDVHVEPKTLI